MEGHRLWAPVYDSKPNPLLALEGRVLRELLGPIPQRRFLDVACGTGRWMTYVHERGGIVFGADLCAEMLVEAHRKAVLRGTLVMADAGNLPFRSRFADVSLCSFAAGYLPNLDHAVAELARVTRTGGKVIISDLHPEGVSNGWTRSFRLGPAHYEMQHFAPSVDRLRNAGERAKLRFQNQFDTCFGPQERPLFIELGKERQFAQVSAIPAVWIGVWAKP